MQAFDFVERILIVLNPDKTLKAAAKYRLKRVINDDGSPFMPDTQCDAEHIAEDDLASVMPDVGILLAQNSALMASADVDATNVQRMSDTIDNLTAQLSAMAAERDTVTERLAQMQAATSVDH